MEQMPATTCPRCGAADVSWRVRRLGNHDRPGMERALEWCCRACDARWTEPAGPAGEAAPRPSGA